VNITEYKLSDRLSHCKYIYTGTGSCLSWALLHSLSQPARVIYSQSAVVADLSECSLVVRASELRLNGHEFDPRLLHSRSVGIGIDDHVWAGISSRYVKLSLLPSVGREMSTDQSAVMCCSWGKRQYGCFHLWINVWVADKTVIPR